ncbi:MAG: ribonuclease P protein subunit [Candidatus Thorarchaeota archaeon]|nr:ribonuclease P protein subunit [Candidatus Thorarchaeota archaeon]
MEISPMNLLNHELIGLQTEVIRSSDPGLVSRSGTIVDESRETILLSTTDGALMLPKANCTFDVHLPNGDVIRLDGQLLQGTPEDRLKKHRLRRW